MWMSKQVHIIATSMHGSAVSIASTRGAAAHVIIIIITAWASKMLWKWSLKLCTTQLFPYSQHKICARDSTFAAEKGIYKPPEEHGVNILHFIHFFFTITRLVHNEWAVERPLSCRSVVQTILFLLASAPWNNPSYLILAGAPRLERGTLALLHLCTARCLLHDGGWRMLRASEAQPLPGERSE